MFLWRFPIQINSKESITEKRRNKVKYLAWNSIRLKFAKRTSMSNPVKSLEYIECYRLSSHRSVKSLSNSIRYNCKKIYNWSRRPLSIYLSIYLSICLSVYLSVYLSACILCIYNIYTKHRVWHTASKREPHSEVWRFVHWDNCYWWKTSLSVVRRLFRRHSLKFVLL